MSFPIQAAIARAAAGNEKPRMKAFLGRVQARPAYQRALERGGKLEILK
jgi:glutathione S-transferase